MKFKIGLQSWPRKRRRGGYRKDRVEQRLKQAAAAAG
jgi:hypothetical protein